MIVTIAVSGMSALGAEVVWTRQLTLLLGGTTYTFSIILAIFLIGLGLGSGIGSYAVREVVRPLASISLGRIPISSGGRYRVERLDDRRVSSLLADQPGPHPEPLDHLAGRFRALPVGHPPGGSPVGCQLSVGARIGASEGQDPGRMVGAVYAANTVGAIAGALVFSTLLIPWLGTQASQRILITVAALSAVLMLAFWSPSESGNSGFDTRRAVWLVLIIGITLGLASSVARIPGLLVAYGRFMTVRLQDKVDIIYVGEGMNSQWPCRGCRTAF